MLHHPKLRQYSHLASETTKDGGLMPYYRGSYIYTAEDWYKEYCICIYFDKNWNRIGCDCSIENNGDLKFMVIPEYIRQASLLWSGSTFRDTMKLGEFLIQTLGK